MTDILSLYKGQSVKDIPTPNFAIVQDKFDANCRHMLNNIQELSRETNVPIKFRAHIKTHKTIQGTLKQLGVGLLEKPKDAIVVSTLMEARSILNYQEKSGKSYVKDICFGIPASVPSILPEMSSISQRVESFRIFVDNIEHLDYLVNFGRAAGDKKWSLFIKIDMGTERAGLPNNSADFHELLKKLSTPAVSEVAELYGFYAHAGHSYHVQNIVDAHQLLLDEITAVNEAAKIYSRLHPDIDAKTLTLSVGATPTSNSLKIRDELQLNEYIKNKLVGSLEVHCGNYCMYDLQQFSTGCIEKYEIAGYVLGSVWSAYNQRKEILTNTGVMALTRESSDVKGHGLCIPSEDIFRNDAYNIEWYVDRVSQEHGILRQYHENTDKREEKETKPLKLDQQIAILPQHACIVMAQFPFYFVLDKDQKVVDVWTPFQKW